MKVVTMEKGMKYTKYEKARMIGARAMQIAMGAPFLIKLDEEGLKKVRYSPLEIARKEYDEGVIPMTVRRVPLKGGQAEQ